MALEPGLREHLYKARFDIHCRNEQLCFHRTRRLSVMGMRAGPLSSHPIERTASTVWPITTDGVPVSSAASTVSSCRAIRRRTRRGPQNRLLGSRRCCSCGGRSSGTPSTTGLAITSTLASCSTVRVCVAAISVLGAASSVIARGVRIAKKTTVRWSTAAICRQRARDEVVERTRFVVPHQLVSFVSEEVWRRTKRRFEAAGTSQYQGRHRIQRLMNCSRHIVGAGHAAQTCNRAGKRSVT